MRITTKEWRIGIEKAKHYFAERENYLRELKIAIDKYGIENLPKDVQKTIPTDFKVLYELPWRFNMFVRVKILQIGWMSAVNEKINEVFSDE